MNNIVKRTQKGKSFDEGYYQLNLRGGGRHLITAKAKEVIQQAQSQGYKQIEVDDLFFNINEIRSIGEIDKEAYFGKFLVRIPGYYYFNEDNKRINLPNKNGIEYRSIFEDEIKKREIAAGRGGKYLETSEKTEKQRQIELTRKKYEGT